MSQMWMVRVGRDSEHLKMFEGKGVVTKCWRGTGDSLRLMSEALSGTVAQSYPDSFSNSLLASIGSPE